MGSVFTFSDARTRDDLVTFLQRAATFSDQGVRFATHPGVVVVTVPVTASAGIMDLGSTILGIRVVRLAESARFDAVSPIAATVEALRAGADLEIPDAGALPAWASISPPRGGWEPVGATSADVVRAAAETTQKEVARLLPDSPGEALIRRIRREVWSDPVHAMPHLTRGAAVALDGLGFLGEDDVRVSVAGPWIRASTRLGDVLEKG
ncbi:hypothetical protein [uncultured Agrococcus sp.]|uniref:hypothetical protein n=1 Tax=uncultured Agrococcus sp. TaxID=382258 RepID=UPI0025F4507B|nr:hypothetical protein [uncultured Agrococcus sp.]